MEERKEGRTEGRKLYSSFKIISTWEVERKRGLEGVFDRVVWFFSLGLITLTVYVSLIWLFLNTKIKASSI